MYQVLYTFLEQKPIDGGRGWWRLTFKCYLAHTSALTACGDCCMLYIDECYSTRMPCESCAVHFTVFKRKRACQECDRYYCPACLPRGGGLICSPCRILTTRPLSRPAIAHLKIRDLQCFLQRQNVSTRGCVEKEDLVGLVVTHVNSVAYRRRPPRATTGPFSTSKGFTNNINELLTSAFDLRPNPSNYGQQTNNRCYNATHGHAATAPRSEPTVFSRQSESAAAPDPTRASGTAPMAAPQPTIPPDTAPRSDNERRVEVQMETQDVREQQPVMESTDCFEIEDVDDSDWEFVLRVSRPLPEDSSVLLTENESTSSTPQRASSEPELRRSPSVATEGDSASLQEESMVGHMTRPARLHLDDLSLADLDMLSIRQLKELLVINRVEFRGCLERADLLSRVRTLHAEHHKYSKNAENLSLEESCKICMAAPLECVLLECGHIAACTACSKQLAECPICRQYVVRAVRFFRS
ncbi:E3 ubiquitin-protein ligase rififylin [Eumeta japonica]|uniref:E3 ubiquitin-protein ligase rififylin n=1 Tax=Eumeta variegata TaxID=151549 RepID=A0A4C1UZY5_EUMVA|nr:E3 ubiquitin-protein ligase rififylin [Eumeta japonica]